MVDTGVFAQAYNIDARSLRRKKRERNAPVGLLYRRLSFYFAHNSAMDMRLLRPLEDLAERLKIFVKAFAAVDDFSHAAGRVFAAQREDRIDKCRADAIMRRRGQHRLSPDVP